MRCVNSYLIPEKINCIIWSKESGRRRMEIVSFFFLRRYRLKCVICCWSWSNAPRRPCKMSKYTYTHTYRTHLFKWKWLSPLRRESVRESIHLFTLFFFFFRLSSTSANEYFFKLKCHTRGYVPFSLVITPAHFFQPSKSMSSAPAGWFTDEDVDDDDDDDVTISRISKCGLRWLCIADRHNNENNFVQDCADARE